MPGERPFDDPEWLRERALDVLSFYYPACIDEARGGYHHTFLADGSTEPSAKPLVGTARFVYDFSVGVLLDGPDWCRPAAERGLEALRTQYHDAQGGYHWEVADDGRVTDASRSCYGHAFVLLAHATAARAGLDGASGRVSDTFDLLDRRFYEPDHGLYLNDRSPDWTETDPYRGQNANMHACEAAIAAHEATGDDRYLDRAETVADAVVRGLATQADGLLWEHYDEDWNADWTYNEDDPENLFRPPGFLPGHFLEWAKLLCQLYAHRPADWLVARAVDLFDAAVEVAWDDERGGFHYTFDRDRTILVDGRYYWVHAEAIGASAWLAAVTGRDRFRSWYDEVWTYATEQFVHDAGVWHRVLSADGEPREEPLSPPNKTDYHTVAACYEAWRLATEKE